MHLGTQQQLRQIADRRAVICCSNVHPTAGDAGRMLTNAFDERATACIRREYIKALASTMVVSRLAVTSMDLAHRQPLFLATGGVVLELMHNQGN